MKTTDRFDNSTQQYPYREFIPAPGADRDPRKNLVCDGCEFMVIYGGRNKRLENWLYGNNERASDGTNEVQVCGLAPKPGEIQHA